MHFNLLLLICLFFPFLAASLVAWNDFSHGRVALENVSIHFRYAGSGPALLLVHGNPQFSLTWQVIGPILAEKYTVIAPDNRGAGDSSIPPDGNYSATASAEDLKGVLDFLGVNETYVFAHDKGVAMAMALAIKYPEAVKMLGLSEYVLPGFGYEQAATPAPYWDLYAKPHLALFQVIDLAEFLLTGKERQFLQWYFYRGSYSGPTSFTEDTVNQYATSITKPGFLRAMLGPYSAAAIAADAAFFTGTLTNNTLPMPILGLGGEASYGIPSVLESAMGGFSKNTELDIIPKTGHWIGDENPTWVAERIARWLETDATPLVAVDLAWLDDRVTLEVGFYGTLGNAALGGLSL
ncbi:hypothetical protein JX265_010782 [Neoarthrinium moseri]|uniref:AB hydrolase-1 domain-containing protein n=1 Tax=Neoarthrinium moseri TaxID=1658444 RepID=A0A9P9WDK9_9PEZI|nr:uncharacterized protein JN550_010652 [Neoarthrinium moseri]KAI1858114.1 hypothetical protein JX265_010782 [Neoarthrinium moseri]KAI1862021.1 hypothetical protein JN550_010652 [Neoarthrinium moseri]